MNYRLIVMLTALGFMHQPALSITLDEAEDLYTWETFQGNAAHTGYIPISLTVSGAEGDLWETEVTSDAILDDNFFIIHHVIGTPLADTKYRISPRLNQVTVTDGRVFVSSYGYRVPHYFWIGSAETGFSNNNHRINYGVDMGFNTQLETPTYWPDKLCPVSQSQPIHFNETIYLQTNTFESSNDEDICGLGNFPNDGVTARNTLLRSIPFILFKKPDGVLERSTLWSDSGKTSIEANQNDQFLAPVMFSDVVYHAGGGATNLANKAGVYSFMDTASAAETTTIENQWSTAGGGDGYVNLAPNTIWSPAVNKDIVVTYTASLSQDSFEDSDLAELTVIDRTTGELTSTITLGSIEYVPPFSNAIAQLNSAPVLADDDTVLIINNGHLINIGLAGEKINWAIDDNFYGQPAVGNEVVYAVTQGTASCGAASSSCLVARTVSAGTPLEDSTQSEWRWVAPSSATINNHFIVTDSHAFVGSSDGNTYAINLSTSKANNDRIDGTYDSVGELSFAFRTLYIAGSVSNSIRPVAVDGGSVADADKSFVRAIQFTIDTSIAADMAVTLSADTNSVRIDDDITYTATVTNNGNIDVTNATLSGLLPNSLSVVTLEEGCTESDQNIVCSLGPLANGASTEVTIVATPTAISNLNFTVEVGSEKIDNISTNDEASDAAEAIAALETTHDLVSTISASVSSLTVGESITYTFTITNSGTDSAPTVMSTMTLTAGTASSLSASNGTCNAQTLTCEIDAIASGSSVTITLVSLAVSEGTLTSTATASSSSASATDADSTNDSAVLSVAVSASTTSSNSGTGSDTLLPSGSGGGGAWGLMVLWFLSGLALIRRKY
ncbi:MAG: DUF11 domain-containing protein [Pseudomonadales bacterium]|nr:DUF11 domain-containing protein [Pseudomonadales bacterium]